MGRQEVLGSPKRPAPSPAPGVSFTHHRRRHLGSTCRRNDVSGSGDSLVTEFTLTVLPCFGRSCGRGEWKRKEDLAPDRWPGLGSWVC